MAPEIARFGDILATRMPPLDGTAFGCGNGMPIHVQRQRDRRHAFGDLLTALTRSLDRRLDISLMRGAFEESLRRSMSLRSVHLRESGARYFGPGEGVCAAPEGIALEVRGADVEAPGVLEATFGIGATVGNDALLKRAFLVVKFETKCTMEANRRKQ